MDGFTATIQRSVFGGKIEINQPNLAIRRIILLKSKSKRLHIPFVGKFNINVEIIDFILHPSHFTSIL